MANRQLNPLDQPQRPVQNPTGNNPVGVSDSSVQTGTQKNTGSSLEDYIQNMLSGGRLSLSEEEFQWLFQNLWDKQNAQTSENWAREDAYTAWKRSLESADYNAKLGLDTAEKQRSQLYNQLIASGMSPAAAMQAMAGITSSGSGSGGSSGAQAATQSIAGAANGGDTLADRQQAGAAITNSVINGLTQIAGTAAGIYYQNKQLNQQQEQFYAGLGQNQSQFEQSLALQREMYQNSQFLNIGLNKAIGSEDWSVFWSNYRDLLDEGLLGEDALYGSSFGIQQLKALCSQKDPDSRAVAAYDAYRRGSEANHSYWTSAIDSQYAPMLGSISAVNNGRLMESQARLNYSAAQLQKAQIGQINEVVTNLKRENANWEQVNAKWVDKTIAELDRDLNVLDAVNDPSTKHTIQQRIASNEEYQHLYILNQAIIEELKNDNNNTEEYKQAIRRSNALELMGIKPDGIVGTGVHFLMSMGTGVMQQTGVGKALDFVGYWSNPNHWF